MPIMNKPTVAGAKLLQKLPEMFRIVEDFAQSNCPPTNIVDIEGKTVYTFGQGDASAFKGLIRTNTITYAKIDGITWYTRS